MHDVDDGALDHRLILAIANGSADALSSLYDRHVRLVFALVRRIVVRSEDTEEVVQDVFAQVWRDANRYLHTRASVQGWLVMMARTRAIDRVRSCRRRPDRHLGADLETCRPPKSSERDPEELTIHADDANRVREALQHLPAPQRRAVDLAYHEGLSHSEIAEKTGIPLGTVKTRLRKAMSTLKIALSETEVSS